MTYLSLIWGSAVLFHILTIHQVLQPCLQTRLVFYLRIPLTFQPPLKPILHGGSLIPQQRQRGGWSEC